MASLPPIKRISKEDLPDAPDWIEKVIYPVNLFFDSVYRALNGRLTSPENIVGQVKELNFQVISTYDGADTDKWEVQKFQSTIGSLAKSLQIMQVTEVADSWNFTPICKDVFIDWEDENRLITVSYTHLRANETLR